MKVLVAICWVMGFATTVFLSGMEIGKMSAQKAYLEQSQKATERAREVNQKAKERFPERARYSHLLEKICENF